MADRQALENALIRAHEAGDTEAASVFAAEIKGMSPSALDRAGRVAGLGARAIATGLPPIGLGLMLGEGLNQGYNLATGSNRPSVFEGWNTFLTKAGLPEPETGVERFSTAVTSGMAGMGGQLRAIGQTAPSLMREALTQVPGRQIVAGGTSAAAGQTAAEMGAGPVGQTIASVAGGMAPFAGSIVRGMGTPELQRTADITRSLRDAGYRLPPTQAGGGVVNAGMETYVAGKAPADRLLSMKNQSVTNRLVKQELGFDKMKPLTEANLNDYRNQVSQPYRDVAALDYEKLVAPGKTYTTAQAVKELSEVRRQGKLEYNHYKRSQDPAALNRHEAHMTKAEEIETFLEQAAKAQGKEGLVDDLRGARTKIAQSYLVERALEPTGNVDSQVFARALDRGEPLTGNLRTIALMGKVYGPAARLPEVIGAPAGRDVLSTYMSLFGAGGVGGGMASGSGTMTAAGLAAMALPVARPMARSLITSRPYQAIMVNPQTPLSRPDAATLGILSSAYSQPDR